MEIKWDTNFYENYFDIKQKSLFDILLKIKHNKSVKNRPTRFAKKGYRRKL